MAQAIDGLGDAGNSIPDQLLESLGRLSKKAGVLATIVIERSSGAILTTTGNLSFVHTSTAAKPPTTLGPMPKAPDEVSGGSDDLGGVEQMAAMVWKFVNAAGGLVHDLDGEDELKLLRMRTKKQELVIVPDTKYLLVAVHETPLA